MGKANHRPGNGHRRCATKGVNQSVSQKRQNVREKEGGGRRENGNITG